MDPTLQDLCLFETNGDVSPEDINDPDHPEYIGENECPECGRGWAGCDCEI